MTSQTVNHSSINELPSSAAPARKSASSRGSSANRCSHVDARGNRCQLSILDSGSRLCFRHKQAQDQGDSTDVSAELLDGLTELFSLEDIQALVFNVVRLLAQGRISPRRAAVLIYAGNLTLRTAMENQRVVEKRLDNEVPRVVFDLPDPHDGNSSESAPSSVPAGAART